MTEQQQIASTVFFSPAVNMQIQTFVFSTLPGSAVPRVMAAKGVTTGDDQTAEPALIVAFDLPQQSADAVTKQVQETRDVDAFLGDLLPAERITSASTVNPNDPPDVLAHIDGKKVGIEAAQLVPPDSELDKSNSIAGRWMSFEQFRNKLLEQAPNTLAQHRGLLVVMHFGGQSDAPAAKRLPPRRANLGSAIAAIRAAVPIVQEGTAAAAPLGNVTNVAQWSSDRSVYFTWTPLPQWYTSRFHGQMGFELALGYHATVTQTDLRNELRRIIEGHNSAKTETLVVTVNAPMRSGLEFPTNALVARMLFEDDQPLDGWTPSRIKHIALHDQGEHQIKWILGSNPWA